MVIICRSTRRSFIYLLSSKDMVMAQVVKFIIRMKVQYPEKCIKFIRFDDATEFVFSTMKTFLIAQEIEHETCVDYAPSQNGSAEAHIKREQQVARTLIMGCSLPASAWGHAVLHANDVLQFRPAGTMSESPIQLLNGEKPSIAHLRIFGCGVYVPIPPPKRTKLGPQRSLRVYLGYESPSIIQYLEPTTGKMFRARFADCVFDETMFPMVGHPENDTDSKEEKETLAKEVKDMLFKGRPSPLVPDSGPNAARVEELVQQMVNLNKIASRAPDAFSSTQGVTQEVGLCAEGKNQSASIDVGISPSKEVNPRRKVERPLGSMERKPRKRKAIEVSRTRRQNGNDHSIFTLQDAGDRRKNIPNTISGESHPRVAVQDDERPGEKTLGTIIGETHLMSCLQDVQECDPKSLEEAQRQKDWPKWEAAMREELPSLEKR
jgi:hypothetical protein